MKERTEINIEKYAFEEILRSAYETLHIECTGTLFGEKQKDGRGWIVESAHPIQLAKRTPNGVDSLVGADRSSWSLCQDYIGGYHSHPVSKIQVNGVKEMSPARVNLSDDDKKEITGPDYIELVIAIRKVSHKAILTDNNPFLAGGYIKNKNRIYRFDLGGYYFNNQKRIRRAKISVPSELLRMLR
jgi:proteasome lid subunit RPN8/RPN11